MATDTAVMFEGRRWPAASVLGASLNRRGEILFSATGKGQTWNADRPLAFWRSFSALGLSDTIFDKRTDARAKKFLSRYGDPFGQLDQRAAAGKPMMGSAANWIPLMEALRQVAAAWDEPDEFGISAWGGDGLRAEIADKALRKLLPVDPDGDPEIRDEIKTVYTRQGLTLWPQTLRAFMVISATHAREHTINMRQCTYCSDWFELRRSDAVYCSPSCQAAGHKRHMTISISNVGR